MRRVEEVDANESRVVKRPPVAQYTQFAHVGKPRRDSPRVTTPEDDTSMSVRNETLLPMRELLDAVSLVVTCRRHGADVVVDPDSDGELCVRGAHLVEHLMAEGVRLGNED